jgi:UDP-N-acetylglucosamine:LPS N-acetylglucosamine transferase
VPEPELTAPALGEKIGLLLEDDSIRAAIAERARRRGRRDAGREIAARIAALAAAGARGAGAAPVPQGAFP